MKNNGLGFHFPVLDVHLVAGQHDGDVLAYTYQISVPIWDIFVRDTGRDVEHDDRALALNIVTVTKASEFLLTCGIPNVEPDGATVGMENQRMDFNSQCCNIFLLEFTGQMAFDESSLASTSVTDEDQLEGGHVLVRCGHFEIVMSTAEMIELDFS